MRLLSLFQDGSNIVKKMNGIFCFRVKDKDGKEAIWVVDAKNGSGSVSFGGPGLLLYSKICLKWPLKYRETKVLMTTGSLMKVKSIAECSP